MIGYLSESVSNRNSSSPLFFSRFSFSIYRYRESLWSNQLLSTDLGRSQHPSTSASSLLNSYLLKMMEIRITYNSQSRQLLRKAKYLRRTAGIRAGSAGVGAAMCRFTSRDGVTLNKRRPLYELPRGKASACNATRLTAETGSPLDNFGPAEGASPAHFGQQRTALGARIT